jgi:hypothetical protein
MGFSERMAAQSLLKVSERDLGWSPAAVRQPVVYAYPIRPR